MLTIGEVCQRLRVQVPPGLVTTDEIHRITVRVHPKTKDFEIVATCSKNSLELADATNWQYSCIADMARCNGVTVVPSIIYLGWQWTPHN